MRSTNLNLNLQHNDTLVTACIAINLRARAVAVGAEGNGSNAVKSHTRHQCRPTQWHPPQPPAHAPDSTCWNIALEIPVHLCRAFLGKLLSQCLAATQQLTLDQNY
eukprot:6183350-Pleurochrysis_carterae.AAC.2